MKQKTMKPLKDLNLTDRFLFDAVAEDPQAHEAMLRIILGREIHLGATNQTEKELGVSPSVRSIRMDVYALDDEDETAYNTEMQNKKSQDIPKRSRYYQSMMDTTLLEPGIPHYNELKDSCIIMITTFDPFGYDRYLYTFVPRCEEEPECTLHDGTVRIFVNTKGKNEEEVSPELVEFLRYVEDTTDERAQQSESELLKRIHDQVCKVRKNEEMGVRYMQAWEERYYELEEAKEEGFQDGRKDHLRELVQKKLNKGLSLEEIADMLEEDVEVLQELAEELQAAENTGSE